VSDDDTILASSPDEEADQINPRVLTWARETAGLTLEEAADRLGLTTSKRSSAASKLADIEGGRKSPSTAQLLRAASAYRRPLVAFYLDAPPARGERGEDFRTAGGPLTRRGNAILDALVVVTREVSRPSKQRANKKIPDICAQFGVPVIDDFALYRTLSFSIT
jgi:transcriptional regulator with XRE-family HTH domain